MGQSYKLRNLKKNHLSQLGEIRTLEYLSVWQVKHTFAWKKSCLFDFCSDTLYIQYIKKATRVKVGKPKHSRLHYFLNQHSYPLNTLYNWKKKLVYPVKMEYGWNLWLIGLFIILKSLCTKGPFYYWICHFMQKSSFL